MFRVAAFVLMTAVVLTVSAAGALADDALARGVVFADRNGNGQRDPDEPGVAGVAVSNQDDVVLTDAEGRYRLPVTDDTILFVSKPSGYRVPVNKDQLPQFYYIHKPGGSPQLRYTGVAPTGPLPESVDFPLMKADEAETLRVVVLADPQVETTQEIQFFRDDVLSELVGIPAAFGITLGDLVSNQLDLYNGYNDGVGRVGIPFYNVIGNHDLNFDAPDDRDCDETFHRVFGPNYYSWNHGRVHFVTLDSVEWLGDHYRGGFGERQLRWLANDLAHVPADRLIVLCLHIPIVTVSGRDCHDRQKLFDVLADRPRVLALAGHEHLHAHTFFDAADGWHGAGTFHQIICATASGSWWSGPKDIRGIPVADCRDGTPNGYNIITFTGHDYVTEFKPAGLDPAQRMRIYPPGSTGIDDLARRRLLVNVFDGSDRCRVEYSLDGAPFVPMPQVAEPDPLAAALLAGVLDSGKPWARPVVSTHLWGVELPQALPRGTHVVTIRVKDHFGRTYEQSRIFVP